MKRVGRRSYARDLMDEVLLPKENVATRWIKTIPIKVNVFAWKLHLDRLPTRSNLLKRGIQVQSSLCPIYNVLLEDTSHLFFSCDVALAISRLICRWWNVSWSPVDSYSGWLEWFNSIRLGSKLKGILEGVFYVSWWCLWNFRNQLLFASKKPRKETLFDDVVSRSFIWSHSRSSAIYNMVKLKATTNTPKKGATNKGNEYIPSSLLKNLGNSLNKDNITSSNSFSALNVEEVENVYDETANLFTKTGESSFTAAAG
ncbi:RNA-directed DNA polymerase, eukaryota [Tanacetum coccineum]